MEQRELDQLVRAITRELAGRPGSRRTGPAAAGRRTAGTPAARPDRDRESSGSCWLVDSWRVREREREAFLSYYQRYVAQVMERLPGYRSGRILVAEPGSDYAWHVQALYEFESDLDGFEKEFDRVVRTVDPRMSMAKVLDGMDKWVLGHEDGSLTEVWR